MIPKVAFLSVLAGICALLCACPDDSVTPAGEQGAAELGAPEQGSADGVADLPRVDSGTRDTIGDTRADVAPPDVALPDTLKPDMAWPAVCDKDCLKLSMYNCTKDAKGVCVECTKAEHCTKNPWSLGPKCLTSKSYCVCTADADCASWPSGKKCVGYSPEQFCGCTKDAECPAGRKCIGYYGSLKICEVPCASNADCPTKQSPLCDKTSGICVACLTDKDCSTGYRLGDRCLKNSRGYKSCGCVADTDCAKNPHGPTCAQGAKRCSCSSDSQCKQAPYTLCYKPYDGAAYAHCQKKCVNPTDCGKGLACMLTSKKCGWCLTDQQCSDKARPYCQQATSSCVACKTDKECTSSSKKRCVPIYGQCAQCATSAHCTAAAQPYCDQAYFACFECLEDKHCSGKGSYTWGNACTFNMFMGRICRCDTNADCVGNPMGPTCFTSYMKCSCTKDADCKIAPHTKCHPPYPSATYKRCQKPCTSDKDCTMGAAPYCLKSDGRCVGCLTAAHCTGGTSPICDSTKHDCAGCKAAKDCSLSRYGGRCDSSKCSCKADADCATGSWGGKCITKSARCGCAAAADCAKSKLGKLCDATNSVCGCSVNTDCPTGSTCTGKSIAGTKICK